MPHPAPPDVRPLRVEVFEDAPSAWSWALVDPIGRVLATCAPLTTWPTRAEATTEATRIVAMIRRREIEVVYPPRESLPRRDEPFATAPTTTNSGAATVVVEAKTETHGAKHSAKGKRA